MTPLTTVKQRRQACLFAEARFRLAIQEAVGAGCPKTDVAKAAGISRPTLYAILNQTERQS